MVPPALVLITHYWTLAPRARITRFAFRVRVAQHDLSQPGSSTPLSLASHADCREDCRTTTFRRPHSIQCLRLLHLVAVDGLLEILQLPPAPQVSNHRAPRPGQPGALPVEPRKMARMPPPVLRGSKRVLPLPLPLRCSSSLLLRTVRRQETMLPTAARPFVHLRKPMAKPRLAQAGSL